MVQCMFMKIVFNVVNMVLIIGEWIGMLFCQGQDYLMFVFMLFGCKGQVMMVDIFVNLFGNYNGIVVGMFGFGKLFFLNELIFCIFVIGGCVWIIDVGWFYEKLCYMFGGQYIEFMDDVNILFNFFSLIEDIDKDMEMLKLLIVQMILLLCLLLDYELVQVEMYLCLVWYDYG